MGVGGKGNGDKKRSASDHKCRFVVAKGNECGDLSGDPPSECGIDGGEEPIEFGGLSLGLDSDGAVGLIAYPASHGKAQGTHAAGGAEPNALHPPGKDHFSTLHCVCSMHLIRVP